MAPRVIPVDPFDLVIFGGTGDLARRKILPGLYRRFQAGQMTGEGRIIGAARAELASGTLVELAMDPPFHSGARLAMVTMTGRTELPVMEEFRRFVKVHLSDADDLERPAT